MLEGGQKPSTIESLPLAMERFSRIKSELSGWATAEISFEFNPKGPISSQFWSLHMAMQSGAMTLHARVIDRVWSHRSSDDRWKGLD